MSHILSLPPSYLSALESQFDLSLENPVPKKLRRFAETISGMSSGLKKNLQRPEFVSSAYLNDRSYCDAYLLYYTTCNLLKIHHPMSELGKSGFFNRHRELRMLDIGSGTGTMILGASLWLNEHYPQSQLHFTAWDQSDQALRTFEGFYTKFAWNYKVQAMHMDLENGISSEEKYHLITGGNVINELTEQGEGHFVDILERNLSPEGSVILIEPALRVASRRLLQLRDRLLQKGWFVYAPCFTFKPCPALVDPGDWCHHDIRWERPAFIAVIDEMIGHIRKSLKFSYLILSRQDIHLSDYVFPDRNFTNQFRVVSDRFNEKGRRRVYLCNDHGRCECLKNKRDHSDKNEVFDELELYDIVRIDGLTEKKTLRQIQKETVIERVGQEL